MIHDELDLTLGTFKIRERGSPAGHNGARSVTGALGTQEWLRLRIGVGLDLPPEAIAAGGGKRPGRDYLLSPMRKADLTVLDEVLDRVATATRRILELGPAAAMNEFNRRERNGPAEEKESRKSGLGSRELGTGLWVMNPSLQDETVDGAVIETLRFRGKEVAAMVLPAATAEVNEASR